MSTPNAEFIRQSIRRGDLAPAFATSFHKCMVCRIVFKGSSRVCLQCKTQKPKEAAVEISKAKVKTPAEPRQPACVTCKKEPQLNFCNVCITCHMGMIGQVPDPCPYGQCEYVYYVTHEQGSCEGLSWEWMDAVE